jgi:AcrR family transcriptional regulator
MKKISPAPKGRPRGFDPEMALQQALDVFWRQGYEGASLTDLTEAMGINRPSLYAAFGNKEQLFRLALERYLSGPANCFGEALKEATARRVVERLLGDLVEQLGDPKRPKGCLVVQGALSCGAEAEPIREMLAEHRAEGRRTLRRRFQKAIDAGELPDGTSAGDLAGYFMSVIHGLAVQAASGMSRKELQGVAQLALKAWPR